MPSNFQQIEIWNTRVSLVLFRHSIFFADNLIDHDDVMKWKHFPRYWPFVRGIHRSPVNSQHKGQWRGALMFSLICVWINGWVNNREAGDLRRHRAHYDVIVMRWAICLPDECTETTWSSWTDNCPIVKTRTRTALVQQGENEASCDVLTDTQSCEIVEIVPRNALWVSTFKLCWPSDHNVNTRIPFLHKIQILLIHYRLPS